MEITDILPRSQILVKELAEGLNLGTCTFEQVEERILQLYLRTGASLGEGGSGRRAGAYRGEQRARG